MFRDCEFEATTETVVNQVRVEVPKWVREVTTAALAKGVEARPTAADLSKALWGEKVMQVGQA